LEIKFDPHTHISRKETYTRAVSYCNSKSVGCPEGNFFHILSIKTRNIIEAGSTKIAPNVPRRKRLVVFIEA
jgi:hypothetical protein